MLACKKRQVWQWMSLVVAMGCGAAGSHEELEVDDSFAQQAATPPTAGAVKPVISSMMIPVSVLGTGTANIHAKIFENPNIPQGATIFDVHGLASTGRVFDPLTQALWNDPSQAARVKRVITIDMPGHGLSSFPINLPRGSNFGSLTLDDNVSVILQALDALRAKSMGPQLIVGHSMGALALTAAQQKLIDKGSSFAKIGVTYVLLIAPIPSHGLPWTQPSSAEAAKLLPFVKYDLLGANAKGIYVQLPTTEWIQASFVDKTGKLTAATPTPAQVEAAGYMAIEPLVTLLQLTEGTIAGGPAPMNRPTVAPGVFDANSGTKLAVVSFSEDGLLLPSDVHNYYVHLTGDKTDFRFLAVNSPDAVHNMTISSPAHVIEAMKILFK
jgi:pimeloyl-ACP methyl ester carboxylesterase